MEQKRYTPSQAARILGIAAWTMRRWMREGKVPALKSQTGRWYVSATWVQQQSGEISSIHGKRCVIYARESSSENKAALESQVRSLTQYAHARGYQIVRIVKEFASGVNDNRPGLASLLESKDFDILLVEHKDRLTRFGFHWFEILCPFRIEVVNLSENETYDLMEDLVAILTSFSARLYGQRRGRIKSQRAIQVLRENGND